MSVDSDPDGLGPRDWRWLRANDRERRARRRRHDSDAHSPARNTTETPTRDSAGKTHPSHEASAGDVEHKPPQGLAKPRRGEWPEASTANEEASTKDALDFGLLDEEVAYAGIDADAPDFDWRDFAWNADEFDEAPDREDGDEVRVDGKVSGRERAKQVAIDLGLRYGWDRSGIQLLTDLFDVRYWGATRGAVERLLVRGMTPDELEIAIRLREFWRDRTEFSIDLSRVSWWAWSGSSAASSMHGTLNWPVALRLVRVTKTLPDVVEIERLLDDLYKEWYCSERLRFAFISFNYYMLYWLEYMEAHPELRNMWMAGFEANVGEHDLNDDEHHFPGHTTPVNQKLNRLGLLPIHVRSTLDEQLPR